MAQTVRPGVNLKLCLLVHITVFAWYVFILYSNCSLDISGRHPGARTYGGRWKYLTFINLVMQTGFFAVCVITDVAHLVVPSRSTRGTVLFLVSARDGLFTVLAAPVGTFVCASFWSLYAYDRELVYPKLIDHIIPVWLNHALHTAVMPLLLLQMYLQHHRHPSRPKAILSLALFASLYLAWVLWVRHISGIWVYPIMARLSPLGLVLFLAIASVSMVPIYLLGEKLSHAVWSTAGDQKLKK
ncbi:androgen dependent TFPI regulating protein 1 isoform X3 [Electrophorus electricus]|uniref:Androgen dependent TFPI regulating protein 1 n=1 Tax=Electrophorus electricus TaxID=8005 RepID=A0A4W4F182_ELEEL|nr:androgen dependent TFPI regulating protein 1 isoform X3 [Electrophorus electricus]